MLTDTVHRKVLGAVQMCLTPVIIPHKNCMGGGRPPKPRMPWVLVERAMSEEERSRLKTRVARVVVARAMSREERKSENTRMVWV